MNNVYESIFVCYTDFQNNLVSATTNDLHDYVYVYSLMSKT